MSTATKADCISSAMEAGASAIHAEAIVDELFRKKNELEAQGKLDQAERLLGEHVVTLAEEARINAALQRKHAALNVLIRRDLDNFLDTFETEAKGDTVEGLMALLGGSHKRVSGARASVTARRWGVMHSWGGGMMKELSERPHVVDMLGKDKDFLANVVREMHELKPEGRRGLTGDQDAAFVAEIFGKYAEVARIRLNDAGAFIRHLEGWTPQSHDTGKMMSKSLGKQEGWVDYVLPRLDHERSFPGMNEAEVREALGEVYNNILTGQNRLGPNAREQGVFLGPRNLARSKGKSRVLHFKDADAFLEYHDAYGRGNVFSGMLEHLERSARDVALMEKLGPNPEAMLMSVIEERKRRVRLDKTLSPEQRQQRVGQLNRAWTDGTFGGGKVKKLFAEVKGETMIPENPTAARIGSYIRGSQSFSKLGSATLSAVADLTTYAMSSRIIGKSAAEGYADAITSLFKGRKGKDAKQLAYSFGTMLDGTLGDIAARWNAQDSTPGKMHQVQNWFFKASWLTQWTERLKAGYSHALSNHLAARRGLSWDALDADIKAVFNHHGFDAGHWEAFKKMTTIEADGKWHLLPENVRKLSGSDLDAFIPEGIKETSRAKRRAKAAEQLEADLMGFYADETMFAVLEPDDRTRAVIVQGTRPGSVMGELVRSIMQFKSFPIAYSQRILRGQRFRKNGAGLDLPGFTHFLAGTVLLGYAAQAAKDFSKGRDPKAVDKWQTWLAAAAQGGGAGIYGDFLFSAANRFGGGALGTAAGPTLGTMAELLKVPSYLLQGEGEKAMDTFGREALGNLPFINLWYARAAVDYAFTYHIKEMISPGSLRRAEKRLKREYGQEYFFPPSDVLGY